MEDRVTTSVAMWSGVGFDGRREAAAGDWPPFGEKMTEVVLRPGQSGAPSLWGACLVGCIGSFREKVVAVVKDLAGPLSTSSRNSQFPVLKY